MQLALIVSFVIVLVKALEYINSNILLIFFSMRVISFFIYQYNSTSNVKYKNVVSYLFFFPALMSGPHVSYNQWVGSQLKVDYNVSLLAIRDILISINVIILSAILIPYWINKEKLSIGISLDNYLVFIFLYVQFAALSKVVISISSMLSVPSNSNFNWPLLAGSVTEFWNRWHISLRLFLSESIHSPMLYWLLKRKIKPQNAYVITTIYTFVLLGLWHLFSIQYLIFGLYFGVVLCIERFLFGGGLLKESKNLFIKVLKIIYVQLVHIVGFSFVVRIIYDSILLKEGG
jgi:alginate O-acetyltransferase complex protein AlgI